MFRVSRFETKATIFRVSLEIIGKKGRIKNHLSCQIARKIVTFSCLLTKFSTERTLEPESEDRNSLLADDETFARLGRLSKKELNNIFRNFFSLAPNVKL